MPDTPMPDTPMPDTAMPDTAMPDTARPAALRPTPPLVLLAAGLGTRFGGGVKPLAPVGPHGEPLLVVALREAARAGFQRAVVVTGPRTRDAVERALARSPVPVALADQSSVGPSRDKPWGTAAAVLAAAPHAGEDGLVVANGDDLYGTPALRAARDWMASADRADALLVAYPVGGTLSPVGGVSRAVVTTGSDGRLLGLSEQADVRWATGRVVTGAGLELAPDALVSMNLWAFRRRALELLASAFARFVATHGSDPGAELGLPDVVGGLLGPGGLSVAVVGTPSRWRGVTFQDDVAGVRAALAEDHESGR